MTRFLKLLTAPCRDIAELVSQSFDTDLSFGQRFAAGLHTLYCSACRRYRRQVIILRRFFASAGPDGDAIADSCDANLSSEAKQRIHAQVMAQRDGDSNPDA